MLYIIHSKCCHNVHSIIASNDMKYTHFMKREEHCGTINPILPLFRLTKPILPLLDISPANHFACRSDISQNRNLNQVQLPTNQAI
jgi:hypothetical protein